MSSLIRSGGEAGSNRASTMSPRLSIRRPMRLAKSSGSPFACSMLVTIVSILCFRRVRAACRRLLTVATRQAEERCDVLMRTLVNEEQCRGLAQRGRQLRNGGERGGGLAPLLQNAFGRWIV